MSITQWLMAGCKQLFFFYMTSHKQNKKKLCRLSVVLAGSGFLLLKVLSKGLSLFKFPRLYVAKSNISPLLLAHCSIRGDLYSPEKHAPWKRHVCTLLLQSPSWNYDPNIRMRLDPKNMVQHQVYTPNCGVIYQGQKVVQVNPHFGVQWLIQYFWCHFQVQTQIFGSNMNLNHLIQSVPGDLPCVSTSN